MSAELLSIEDELLEPEQLSQDPYKLSVELMSTELLSIEDELLKPDELSQDPNKLVVKFESAELFSIESEFSDSLMLYYKLKF